MCVRTEELFVIKPHFTDSLFFVVFHDSIKKKMASNKIQLTLSD